ncbi:hypothetical protein DB347_16360 [Opitutaceae bacterium EW11]|nr:hypothetical protein DB347_16360 [Opitutaceae bacterium EW11]
MVVTLIAAQSVDGFITRHDQPGSGFTSQADKHHFRTSLRDFDVRIMGATTYRVTRDITRRGLAANRLQVVMTRQPEAFRSDVVPGQLEFFDSQPDSLLSQLVSRGYQRCALLGGAQIHSLFLEAEAVDSLWLTIEPVLFGHGTHLIARTADIRLQLLSSEALSADTLLLKYQVVRT